MNIAKVFKQIQETPGTNDKKKILVDNMNDVIKMIFEDTYGPQKYYIKRFIKPNAAGSLTIDKDYYHFRTVLFQLADRTITGHAAYEFLYSTVMDFNEESQDILCRIIDRNLKIGISKDNYNETIGGGIEKFEVALAFNLEKVKNVDPLDGTWYVSRKCDGVRCITFAHFNKMTKEYEITFKSRQGKEFKTLDKLKPVVADMIYNSLLGFRDYVLDGEICILDEDGNEHFNWVMKEITRKNHTIEYPHYKLFDFLTTEEFNGEEQSDNFCDRYARLNHIEDYTDYRFVSVLTQERITSQEDFERWSKRATEYGWEGLMLRKDVPYESGRTKSLLKVKKFLDNEYIVEDVVLGKATYNKNGAKEYDICSALVINHKGNRVEVGSGLSFEQRVQWFNNPQDIIGKTITVQYFEETTNKNNDLISLRFPVLKYVYDDGRNV